MLRTRHSALLLLTLYSSVVLAAPVHAADVINNVSVSAHSGPGGKSTIQSTTIVNGTTVNEVHRTGTGTLEYHYQSTTTTTSSALFASTSLRDDAATRTALQALVLTLHHYVSYLTTLLAASAVQHE